MKKYPTTLGIEYTVVPQNCDIEGAERICDDFIDWLEERNNFAKSKLLNLLYRKLVLNEYGALEFSSSILANRREVYRFYQAVWEILNLFAKTYNQKKIKWVANTHCKNTYIEGGGGHLHLGVPFVDDESAKKFNETLFAVILNAPELHWIMSEWCDDEILLSSFYHGISAQFGVDIKEYSMTIIRALFSNSTGNIITPWGHAPIQYRKDTNYDNRVYPTHEFRFFGAPTDYNHLIDNIDLAMAIWQYTRDNLNNYMIPINLRFPTVDSIRNYSESDLSVIIQNFNAMLGRWGLKPERYKKYHKNLINRRKYGRFYTTKRYYNRFINCW